ncbi:MAG: NFACT family protein [Candidatus Aenigmarchaeota archaeon]|nr:NFACT family protein [Candidatus Aenigmarchaeota archaeon]
MTDKAMTSFEIAHAVRELRSVEGAHIGKIYYADKELALNAGGMDIRAFPGACFLAKERKDFGGPTNFAMILRKHLKNKIIKSVYQHGTDRIVVIETEDARLVIELFHKGNFILTDKDWVTIMPAEFQKWKDRVIIPRKKYSFPESRDIRDPATLEREAQGGVEKTLVVNGLGKYAREAMHEAGVKEGSLDSDGTRRLAGVVESFFTRKTEAFLVKGSSGYEDAIPFGMKMYGSRETVPAGTFSEALARLYSFEKKQDPYEEKKEAQKRILEQQRKRMDEFVAQGAEQKRRAEILKRNFSEADALLKDATALRSAKKLRDATALLSGVVSIDEKKGTITVRMESEGIELSLAKSMEKNIGNMYERAKFYAAKSRNTAKEMGNVLEKLDAISAKQRVKEEKKEWYHKYRHFFTSDGFLCVGGKDAESNESLIKKHTETRDVVLHAEIHGSPFVVIKPGDAPSVTEQSIKEAAQFTACYSKAWAMGLGSVNVYWITPEQVTKSPPSGEHITKGSFMIEGKKNYANSTKLALACTIINGRVSVVPLETAARKTVKYVEIVPGDTDAKRLSKRALEKLKALLPKAEQHLASGSIDGKIPAGRGALGD